MWSSSAWSEAPFSADRAAAAPAEPETIRAWSPKPLSSAYRLPPLLYTNVVSPGQDPPHSGGSISVIPSYQTINPALRMYQRSPVLDTPVAAEAETTPGYTPTRLRVAVPSKPAIALYYQFNADETTSNDEMPQSWTPRPLAVPKVPPAAIVQLNLTETPQDQDAPTEPETVRAWQPKSLWAIKPSTAYLFSSGTQDDSAPVAAEADTLPMWQPQRLSHTRPSTAYLFASGPQDLPPIEIGRWAPTPLRQTRPSTAYLFSPGEPSTSNAEMPESWIPKPLQRTSHIALYLFSRTAQDDSAPVAPDAGAGQSWRPAALKPAYPPVVRFTSVHSDAPAPSGSPVPVRVWMPKPLWVRRVPTAHLYLFNRDARDTSAPIQPSTSLEWRPPVRFKPAYPPVVSMMGIKADTPPIPAASIDVAPTSVPQRMTNPSFTVRAASLYYQTSTAEDFGEQPINQFLVFWQYRTKYEDRVRQFFLRSLQGKPPQDNDSAAQPSTLLFWPPRSLQTPSPPRTAINNLYFTAPEDVSLPTEAETTVPWTAQRLQQNPVPKSAFVNLYFSESAQDFDAPIEPETTPQQWMAQRVTPSPTPRSAFLNYYQSAPDVPIIEETQPNWTPKPLWDTPTPVSSFLNYYFSATAQDEDAPVDIGMPYAPRPLRRFIPISPSVYLFSAANAEQSAPEDIGRSGWVPGRLQLATVPRAAHLYYRSATAQDDDAPAPPPPPFGHGGLPPLWLRRARLLLYHP